MRTASQCYLIALQKSEQNLTNGGIKMDKARFVQLFNSEQNRLIQYILGEKINENIRKIQQLVVYYKKLSSGGFRSVPKCDMFDLPDDYFAFSNISARFIRGRCLAEDFSLFEVKNEDVNEFLSDENHKPSFEYRETFYTIGQESVAVYKDDFDIESVFLTYYRYPKQINLEGYRMADGSQSYNSDPELDDKLIDEILNMVQKQYALNENEPQRYQFDSNNVNQLK